MIPDVAIVVSPRDWAEALHRFVADHGGARVRARVLDGREALDERYHVLVAEDLTSFLTPRLVSELHRSGRRILGVYDPTEPWGRERLAELGVDESLPSTASPEEILRTLTALAVTSLADLDAELAAISRPDLDRPPDAPTSGRPPGRLTVVGAPAGGSGATEVAIALATQLRRRAATVLVDADDVAPSVAQRLGLPLHPNLRTAIDVVEHASGRIEEAMAEAAGGVPVVCGLPNAVDAVELRSGEVVDVLTDLARGHRHVLANIGHRLEEVAGRHAIARDVLAAADVVVAVAAATPVGLARLLEWVADARALTRAPVHVVVNRVPSGRFKRGELEEELRRTFSPPTLILAPDDRRVGEAAWAGDIVTSGPFVRALRPLVDVLHAAPRAEVVAS